MNLGARYSYLQDISKLLKNKDREDGVYCLEWAMGSSWWEWSVGSRCFLLSWPMDFWSGIRGGYNQWQVGPWYRFIQPQRVERDK